MTDKQRNIGQWVTIALTMILMLSTVIGSSVTMGERSKANEKKNVNQDVQITAIKEEVNKHAVKLAILPEMKEDIKDIKIDQKQFTITQNKMMKALTRIETKLEIME